jgi:glycine cleavage system H protein
MEIITGLKYTKNHEWLRVEGNNAYIGLTNYAQLALGDIIFIELPQVNAQLNAEETLGVVECAKAASDIFTPVSGVVIQINKELEDSPEKINNEPYLSWIALIQMSNPLELNNLMDEESYEQFCSEEG